jgi:septal ring factor EnvC (AmiA/AmiB activator)
MNLEEEFERYAVSVRIERNLEKTMQAETALALRSISSAIDLAKRLIDIGEKSKNSELILAIANLNLELSNAKLALANSIGEMAELKAENADLKQRIKDLEKQSEEKLVLKGELYYTAEGDGPFCTACQDSKHQKIRVRELPSAASMLGKYQCPICKTPYKEK